MRIFDIIFIPTLRILVLDFILTLTVFSTKYLQLFIIIILI